MDLALVNGITLVVNVGSSSIKLDGVADTGEHVFGEEIDLEASTPEAVSPALTRFWSGLDADIRDRITSVGHRVVHGGDQFIEPTIVDDDVIAGIEECVDLAPLHNPLNLAGLMTMRELSPDTPQIAVFDTAFHRGMPTAARLYPIPRDISAKLGIERFGFHGISIDGAVRSAARLMRRPVDELRFVVAHLGSGASVTAVRNGHSIDTTMGWTPLEGVMMATRSGDLDPSIVLALVDHLGSTAAVEDLLEHGSGLLGLGGSADMRVIEQHRLDNEPRAVLAYDVFVHRIRRAIGAMHAVVEGADAIIFTAGIAEHDPRLREAVCAGWARLGLDIDPRLNREVTNPTEAVDIAAAGAPIRVIVVPADEAAEIARQVRRILADPD